MGAAAAALADHVVVTSDNPRSEDPGAIIAEVLAGTRGARDARRGRGAPGPPRGDRPRRRAGPAGRRGRRRGQGPRAGPGARRRPQGPLRRRRPSRARPSARCPPDGRTPGTPRRSRGRPAAGCCTRRWRTRPGGPGPARVVIDSREAGPGDLFVGLRGEHADGGALRARRAGGGRLGRPGGRRARRGARPRPRRGAGRRGRRRGRPARRARGARAGLAPPPGLPRGRHHRLDRQDVDEGRPGGDARASTAASWPPRATGTPRSGCR